MNRDSTTFMAKLVETKRGVAAQQSQQGPRGAEIAQQAGRIATTGTQAQVHCGAAEPAPGPRPPG